MAERTPAITVLAGANGAGKSSVIGTFIRLHGGTYYNPDEAARKLRTSYPALDPAEANRLAWRLGKEGLETAINRRRDYVFETTLGGRTIPALLGKAAQQGCHITIWYIGLDSVEEHIRRVKARVERGGHDIAEDKIRERYIRSLENLVALMPYLYELRVFDNSATVDLSQGERPGLQVLLHLKAGRIIELANLRSMPAWAKPIIAAAGRIIVRDEWH